MAYKENPGDDLYDRGEPEKAPDEKGDDATAVLPKAILAGKEFKPGDEIVLKVVHVGEDDVVVEYAHGGEGDHEEEASEPAPEPAPQPKGEMADMME